MLLMANSDPDPECCSRNQDSFFLSGLLLLQNHLLQGSMQGAFRDAVLHTLVGASGYLS